MPKNIGDTAMSLRDELTPVRTGNKSRIEIWLETQPQEFIKEFNELVQDKEIAHTQLHKIATKYGCEIQSGRFTAWRKQQWASKTK